MIRPGLVACSLLFAHTRALELSSARAAVLPKADPKKDPDAKRYDKLSYYDVLSKDLRVMDASAVALMRDNDIPIVVFSIRKPGGLSEALAGRGLQTIIGKA